MMTLREVVRELDRLRAQPPTIEDWRDLYTMINDYEQRRLARAIAAMPRHGRLIEAIRALAGIEIAP
ncbi:MAG TPA: hypothetical protein VMR92_08520 [Gemmatimonadales bacterium]|nr:hypothetical protein [Gemmatimonadales bacterium]